MLSNSLGFDTSGYLLATKTKVIPFFIVDSRFNPIVGLSDSVAFKVIKLNAPLYNTWSSNNPVSTIAAVGTDQNYNTMQNNEVPEKPTNQFTQI